jgi:hypothetical protein
MLTLAFTNNLASSIASALTASAGSQTVQAPTGMAAAIEQATGGFAFNMLLTLSQPSGSQETAWEIVEVTAAVAGNPYDTLTITRAYEATPTCPAGGNGLAWAIGSSINARPTVMSLQNVVVQWLNQRPKTQPATALTWWNDNGALVQTGPAVVPGAPTGVAATPGNASASVAFTPPTVTGGAPITGYVVTASPGGVSASGAASPIALPGLINGVSYTVSVQARNSVGLGSASTPSAAFIPSTVPSAPTGVSASIAPGSTTAQVAFTPGASGGEPITGFTATSTPGGLSGFATSSPINVPGLSIGTPYTFTVTAANMDGTGLPSAPSNQITPSSGATVPGAPTINGVTPGNASAVVSVAPGATGGSPITGYVVKSTPGSISASGPGPVTVNGLTNGTGYQFQAAAVNAIGTGPYSALSASVTPSTVPSAPTGVSAVAGNGQATVSFTPGGNGGAAITDFTVVATPGGAAASGSGSPITVPGLSNGVSYTFVVYATNSNGPGPNSAPSSPVVPAAPPATPTINSLVPGNGSLQVNFTPGATGGATPTYTATASPGGATASGAGSPLTLAGLTNGTPYTVSLVATSSGGASSPASAGPATPVAGSAGPLSTTLGVTSPVAGTVPFTFGQPIKQGDVPAGQFVQVAGASNYQARVVNSWPDGSAKLAILSGHYASTANVLASLALTASLTAPAGANITEAQLIAAAPTATMQCGSIGTVSLASLMGTVASGPDGTGLVRSFLGPVMSEFHYRGKVGTNAHLRVYFVCRAYSSSGAGVTSVEVESLVENGFTNVPAPQMWTYVPTLTVGGVQVWTNGGSNFNHYHHTRVGFVAWAGATAYTTTPSHNLPYAKASRVVPNYGATTTSSTYLNGLASSYVPYMKGDYQAAWGVTGRQDQIGLLPNWEAAYWTDGAPQAWQATIVNAYVGMGFYHHYRDETTGRPVKARSYPAVSWGANPGFTNGSANQGGTTSLPANDDNFPPYPQTYGWNEQHHPQIGVTAYLTTGRWSFMEELQFLAGAMGIDGSAVYGWHASNGSPVFDTVTSNSTRGCAWIMRDQAWAMSLSADDAVLQASDQGFQAEYQRIFNDNVAWYVSTYAPAGVPANPLGVFKCYDNSDWGGVGPNNYLAGDVTGMCMFEQDFFTASLGLAWDQQLVLGSTGAQNLGYLLNFAGLNYAGRTGLQTNNETCFSQGLGVFCWELSPNNPSGKTIAQFNSDLTATANWYNALVATFANSGYTGGLVLGSCAIGNALQGNSGAAPSAPQSFWDNAIPGLSILSDYGAPGCAQGFAYVTIASNWSTLVGAFADNPVWYILPRTQVPGLPYSLPTSGNALAIPNSAAATPGALPSAVSSANWEYSLMESWSGGCLVPDYSTFGAYVLCGTGGHEVQPNLGAAIFDFTAGAWAYKLNANGITYAETNAILGTIYPNDFQSTTDVLQPYGELQNSAGRFSTITGNMPAPTHCYLGSLPLPAAAGGGAQGSVLQLVGGAAAQSPDVQITYAHRFDLATGTWMRYSSNAITSSTGWGGTPLEDAPAVFDSSRVKYYCYGSGPWASNHLAEIDPTSGAWTGESLGAYYPSAGSYGGTSFYDPKRDLLVTMFDNGVPVWAAVPAGSIGSGATVLTVSGMPTGRMLTRWDYYPPGDCFYTHFGDDTNTIYKLTPPAGSGLTGTWTVTAEPIGGATMPLQGSQFGTYATGGGSHYSRFFYVPALECFAWIASINDNVVLVKP